MVSKYLSLERQFHFYRAYHSNSVNRRIHNVFVPIIYATTLVFLAEIPLPQPFGDLSLIVTLAYMIYYCVLDFSVGSTIVPFIGLLYWLAHRFREYAGPDGTLPWGLTLHMLGWVAQFVGHYAFEGKSPALMDSLIQAILAAPIVIWLDILFSMGLMLDTKARLLRSRAAAQARKASAASR